MPTVPRYNSGQVEERALPNARVATDAPIEAFGGGASQDRLAQATQQSFKIAEKIFQEEKQKADDTMTQKAYTELGRRRQKLGEEAFTKKGEGAIGVVDEYVPLFDKDADDIEKNMLKSDSQRALFRRIREQEKRQFTEQLGRHSFVEKERFADETAVAGVQFEQDDAIQNYQEPGRIQQAIGRQMAFIDSRSQGKPKEFIENMKREAASKTHAGVIERMLSNGQDMQAAEYYKQIKPQMGGMYQSRIEKALEDGSLRGQSQRMSDQIISEYSDLGAAREAVRQIKDPKLRDAVDDRVRSEFSIRSQQETVARGKNFMEAYSILEQTKKANGVVHVEDIPQAQWSQMTPDQRDAARSLVKRLNSPEEIKHDDAVYLKYLGMSDGQLSRVTEADLLEKVRPYVKEQYYKEIAHKWAAVRDAQSRANNSKAMEVKSMYTDEEMVLNGLRGAKIGGINEADTMGEIYKSESKATMYRQFREQVDAAWMAEAYENGGKITPARKKQIVEELAYKTVFVSKRRFGLDYLAGDVQKPAGLVTDEERGSAYIPIDKIDPATQDEMRNYIKSLGKKVTVDKLQRMRAARLMGNRELYKAIGGE